MTKLSAEARKRIENQQGAAVLMEKVGMLIDVALRDTFLTQPHQIHRQALERFIDARIHESKLHVRAWRACQRAWEYLAWRAN